MLGPKQLVEFLSGLLRWNRPPPKKQIYKIVPDDEDLEALSTLSPELKFDWRKASKTKKRALQAAETAGKKADRVCCRGYGSSLLIFALLVSLLLSLTYIGKLHSSPGCAGGAGQAAFQLATAFKTTLSSTQTQLQKVATSILGRPDDRTLLVGIVTESVEMETRAMLREVYSPVVPHGVDVVFVFPRQDDEKMGLLLELEAQKFGDIVVLNDTMTDEDGLGFAVRLLTFSSCDLHRGNQYSSLGRDSVEAFIDSLKVKKSQIYALRYLFRTRIGWIYEHAWKQTLTRAKAERRQLSLLKDRLWLTAIVRKGASLSLSAPEPPGPLKVFVEQYWEGLVGYGQTYEGDLISWMTASCFKESSLAHRF